MITLSKIIVATVLSMLMLSCNFSVKSNEQPVTQKRTSNVHFNEINVCNKLEVYITQDTETGLRIQAEENVHDIILTSVENNILSIYTSEDIT